MRGSTSILKQCSLLISVFLYLQKGAQSIAVTSVLLLSESNRQEYVLHGEGATLTCHYLLDQSEKVTEVEWEKDGVLVYVWSLDDAPKAFDVLEGHVDTQQKSPGTLEISKVHLGMQGTYTCRVRTNGKTAQNEAYVMVIVDACSDDAWKTHTDMIACTETISMHCVGISPKPSPACGVYSESTGKFLNSIPFDSVNHLWNGTFEVSFNRRFEIADWINHTDVSFNCFMLIMGTTWRSGVRHRMFGDPGCSKDPPSIKNGHYNMTTEKSCWGHPKEGTLVEYQCHEGYSLLGPNVLVCRDGFWSSSDNDDDDNVVFVSDDIQPMPICNKGVGWKCDVGVVMICAFLGLNLASIVRT